MERVLVVNKAYKWIKDHSITIDKNDPLYSKVVDSIAESLNKGKKVVCCIQGKLIRIVYKNNAIKIQRIRK